jgi:TetR/AcrR family transcriptional regulator
MPVESRVQRRMLSTRKRLLESALALFAKNGIYETTVENIAEAADVGKGTFYEHFPSKTGIIQHLLHAGFGELMARCRHEAQSATRAKERVKRLLWVQFQFFSERRDLLILFHQGRGLLKLHPDEARLLQKEYRSYVHFLLEELGASLDPRRYSPATLKQMAYSMAGFVTGYLSYRAVAGARRDQLQDLRVPCRIFLDGIEGDGWQD